VNRLTRFIFAAAVIAVFPNPAWAGEFYKISPSWLEFAYYLSLLALIAACLYTGYSIYSTMQGGKLGLPWAFVMSALSAVLLRTILGFLSVIEVAFFKAIVFAVLDILFFLLLLIGLLLYKKNLE